MKYKKNILLNAKDLEILMYIQIIELTFTNHMIYGNFVEPIFLIRG